LLIPSIARSKDTLDTLNKETTSREIKISDSLTILASRPYKSKLFLIWPLAISKLSEIILCKNAKEYRALETIVGDYYSERGIIFVYFR